MKDGKCSVTQACFISASGKLQFLWSGTSGIGRASAMELHRPVLEPPIFLRKVIWFQVSCLHSCELLEDFVKNTNEIWSLLSSSDSGTGGMESVHLVRAILHGSLLQGPEEKALSFWTVLTVPSEIINTQSLGIRGAKLRQWVHLPSRFSWLDCFLLPHNGKQF